MIIFLYGEDSYRSRQKLKELKEKYTKEIDTAGNSLVVLDGEKISMEKINESVAAPSLFARKRMIVIEKMFANQSKELFNQAATYFQKYLGTSKEKEDENIIIFWDDIGGEKMGRNKLFQFLLKADFVQNFKPLSNTEAIAWIIQRSKSQGVTIRRQAAVHLTSLFGSDLWQICNEINKLVSFKLGQVESLIKGQEEVIIEMADVDRLARGKFDENIFALTDAISNKNKAKALELFENEVEGGVTESYLMFMIIRQFKILMQIRQSLDLGHTSRKIISQLKLHPYVVQKTMSQVRNYSLQNLKNIFSHLISVDSKLKTGQIDFRSAIGLLIAGL